MVGTSNAARRTVEDRVARDGMDRRIGAHLPEFSGVAPLLARRNMLATPGPLFMADDKKTHGLVAKYPLVDLPDITFRFFWSARLSQDPGRKWLRSIVIGADERVNETVLGALRNVQ